MTLAPSLAMARAMAQSGRQEDAERAFAALLAKDPTCLEAYSFLVMRAHRRRDYGRAIMLLERALLIAPEDSRFLTDLGQIHRGRNHFERAEDAFRRAIKSAPENFEARVYLGAVLEKTGRFKEALIAYIGAIEAVRLQGAANDVKGALRAEFDRAANVVVQRQREIFSSVIAPLADRYGRAAIARVEKFLAIYLGELAAGIPDARQKPIYFYFPDIPSQTYFDHAQIPWATELEAATDAIRDEALTIASGGALPPFLSGSDTTKISSYLSGGAHAPSWDAFFFYKDGERIDDSHRRAPTTSALLDRMPLVRVKGSAPEICYSLLTPGTVIERHSGVANFRIVVHLPLVVPEGCALKVGGELHEWQEGRCVAFDDTFEHEAWNKHDSHLRIVLLMDAWNPHLSDVERIAITELVGAIGDLNRAALS